MLISGVTPLAVWYGIVLFTGVSARILPAPHEVVAALPSYSGEILAQAAITIREILLGSAAGVASGIGLAALLTWSRLFDKAFMPWIVFLHSVPKIMIAPLFAIWFGTGGVAQVTIVALVVFFPILITTVEGLKSVENDMVDLMRTTGAGEWQTLMKVRIPSALPMVFDGLKVAAGFATVGAIVAEWIAGDDGLGLFLLKSEYASRTSLVFAIVLVIVVLGLALYQLVVLLERVAMPWHVTVRARENLEVNM